MEKRFVVLDYVPERELLACTEAGVARMLGLVCARETGRESDPHGAWWLLPQMGSAERVRAFAPNGTHPSYASSLSVLFGLLSRCFGRASRAWIDDAQMHSRIAAEQERIKMRGGK